MHLVCLGMVAFLPKPLSGSLCEVQEDTEQYFRLPRINGQQLNDSKWPHRWRVTSRLGTSGFRRAYIFLTCQWLLDQALVCHPSYHPLYHISAVLSASFETREKEKSQPVQLRPSLRYPMDVPLTNRWPFVVRPVHAIFLNCCRNAGQHYLLLARDDWEDSALIKRDSQHRPNASRSRCSTFSGWTSESLLSSNLAVFRLQVCNTKETRAYKPVIPKNDSRALLAITHRCISRHRHQHRRPRRRRYCKDTLQHKGPT